MKIPNNPETFSASEAVMATWQEGVFRRFALHGRTDIVSAEIVGDNLLVYPDRSSAHKALLVALGGVG